MTASSPAQRPRVPSTQGCGCVKRSSMSARSFATIREVQAAADCGRLDFTDDRLLRASSRSAERAGAHLADEELLETPRLHLEYLSEQLATGQPALGFVFVRHVLVAGPVDISGLPLDHL